MKVTETTKSLCTIALLAAAGFGLTGCTSNAGGFEVLDRPADASDELPADLPANATENYDAGSARFVAEDDGRRLYLLKNEESKVCLLVYSPDNWLIGCGGDHFKLSGREAAYEVWADGHAPVEEGNKLSPNVYAVD